MPPRNYMGQYERRQPGFIRRTAGRTVSLLMLLIKIIGVVSLLLGFFVAFMIFFPDHAATEWVRNKIQEYEIELPEEVRDKVIPTTTPAPPSAVSTFLGFLVDALVVLAVLASISFLIYTLELRERGQRDEEAGASAMVMALTVISFISVFVTKNNSSIGKWILLVSLVLSAVSLFSVKDKFDPSDAARRTAVYAGTVALLIVLFRAITGFAMAMMPLFKTIFWIVVIVATIAGLVQLGEFGENKSDK